MSQGQLHPGPPTGNSRARADALRKSGQYAAAADAYAATWPDGDPWTGWAYAFCLRKLKRSEESLGIIKAVMELAPDFALARSLYAWALFDTIREANEITTGLLDRAETVLRLTTSQEAYERVSPFVPTVLGIARLLSRKGRYEQVLHWLRHLDPTHLGTDEFLMTDPQGKQRRLASQRERYHGLKTHALEKLERWTECLAEAEVALTACSPLHYDNDVWFARRIARAKINLERCEEGIAELLLLARRKPTSFIYYDIAEASTKIKDHERAFENCVLALQCPGDLAYKLPALLLIARLLWNEGKKDEARLHLTLYMAFRKEKGWGLSGNVSAMASEWGAGAQGADVNKLFQELRAGWRKSSKSSEVRRSGTVERILPHGQAGFILAADRERFYFDLRDWRDPRRKPTQGTKVTFSTKPSFDRKRQKPSVVACDIRNGA